jgi:hypothetical protein
MSLADFIKGVASARGYNLHDGDIDITIPYTKKRFYSETDRLFPGCVYGIAVELTTDQKRSLFQAAQRLRQADLTSIDEWNPIYGGNVYPLYWGKEWNSGSRLYAHLSGHSGNKTLCLYEQNYPALEGVALLYASVKAYSHEQLEVDLKSLYPTLMKTVKGKGPKVCP